MKCLVLGGGSLKGQEMARFLSRMGQQVTVTTLPQEPLDCGADCRVLRADLLDPQAIEDALRQAEPDYVFDFAAQNSVNAPIRSCGEYSICVPDQCPCG